MDLLYSCLPPDIMEQIFSLHVVTGNDREDKLIWSITNSGILSVKITYLSLSLAMMISYIIPWKWDFILKLKLPLKLVTFPSTIGNGKVLTNV